MPIEMDSLVPAALAAAGLECRSFEVARVEASGAGQVYSVGCRVRKEGAEEQFDEQDADQWLSVSTDPDYLDAPGTLTLRDPASGERAAVWSWPGDPALPALAATAFPASAGILMGRLGLGSAVRDLSVVVYRPARRAVLRAEVDGVGHYLKIVKPRRVAAIIERQEALHRAGVPVPRIEGSSPEGLIVMAEGRGVPATTLIDEIATDPAFLDSLADLRARLATVPLAVPARTGLLQRIGWYAERLAQALPAQQQDLVQTLAAIERDLVSAPTSGVIHGDLHLDQILVDPQHPATITALLDVDTAGRGPAAIDDGCLRAHLIVLAERQHSAAAQSLADRLSAASDDAATRASTALHLIGHAVGPALSGEDGRGEARALLRRASEEIHGSKSPLTAALETA